MKRFTFFIFVTIVFMNVYAQSNNTSIRQDRFRVLNWGKQLLLFRPDFWNDKAEGLTKQLGENKYNSFLKFNSYKSRPDEMLYFGATKRKMTVEQYEEQMNRLVMFKVATYIHTGTETVEYSILEVPYAENRAWVDSAKWDTLYFVVPTNELQIVK